jgi:hypothetical protein
MTTPLVLLGLAIVAGVAAWVLSMRQSSPRSSWEPQRTADPRRTTQTQPVDISMEEPGPTPPSPPSARAAESFVYVPLDATDDLNARTRLLGIAGLIAVIVLSSAAVAIVVVLLAHAIGLQLSHFVKFANG